MSRIFLLSFLVLTCVSHSSAGLHPMYEWSVVRMEAGKTTTMSFKGESVGCGKVVVDVPRAIADFGVGIIEKIEVEPQICYNVLSMQGGAWETGRQNSWITRSPITLAKVHGGPYNCSVDWRYVGSSTGPVDVVVLLRLIPEECEDRPVI